MLSFLFVNESVVLKGTTTNTKEPQNFFPLTPKMDLLSPYKNPVLSPFKVLTLLSKVTQNP